MLEMPNTIKRALLSKLPEGDGLQMDEVQYMQGCPVLTLMSEAYKLGYWRGRRRCLYEQSQRKPKKE